jgi:hypothetical protein
MSHPASATGRLYVPHTDGTLTGSPLLAGERLPVLTDLGRAREFLASYFAAHPVEAAAGRPARPLALCEVDATITSQGRLTLPVDRDQALTQPHRQVVTAGALQRPHPRALTVAYTIAWSQANSALHPTLPGGYAAGSGGAAVRARDAVQIAWRHGHDVAYANSWRAVAGTAETMGHRLAVAGPSVRTPAAPPQLLSAAARLAGSGQIDEIIEHAWRSGLAHGGRRGAAHAAAQVTAGRPAVLGSAVATITAEWTNPQLAQLTSELAGLDRTHQPQRAAAVLSRLETYLAGWRHADPTVAARPAIPRPAIRLQQPPARRPPPPVAGTGVRRGPTR